MYILGAGVAFPETVISDSFLLELRGNAPVSLPLVDAPTARRSILAVPYLRETKNSVPHLGVPTLVASPGQLVEQAAKQAIARAGIAPEQIGLIVGEATAPLQTTPSEAQRLGNALNLKVPAYDVAIGGNGIALQLHVLRSWDPEMVPDYALLISVATPTQQLDYARDVAGYYLGDSAVAVVVSLRDKRGLLVRSLAFESFANPSLIVAESYGSVRIDLPGYAAFIDRCAPSCLAGIVGHPVQFFAPTILAPCHVAPLDKPALWQHAALKGSAVIETVTQYGFGSASGVFGALAMHWDEVTVGGTVAVAAIGGGTSAAWGVLERI